MQLPTPPSTEKKSAATTSENTQGSTATRTVDAGSAAGAAPTRNPPLATARWGTDEPASPSVTRTALLPRTRAPGRWTRFELDAPEAQNVFLAGTFNKWSASATPMMRLHDRKWARELWLPLGQYEYLFVVDGKWIPDPESSDRVTNPFGGHNSVVQVD